MGYRGRKASQSVLVNVERSAEDFVVELRFDGSLLVARIVGPVFKDGFDAYRLHCRRFKLRYRRKTLSNEAELEAADFVGFVAALQESEFKLQVNDDFSLRLAAAQKELAEENEVEIATVSVDQERLELRIEALEKELLSRELSLFAFQSAGIRWLAARKTALLADDMGLGKTLQALLAAPAENPVLVVCPAIAKGVWQREAALWRPDLKVVVLEGKKSFRWPVAGELVVVNYAILPSKLPMIAEEADSSAGRCAVQTVLIADEAHALKNQKALRSKRFLKMSQRVQKRNGFIWLLTATPLLNRPPELWQVLRAANLAEEAFTSWNHFKMLFNAERVKVARGVWALQWGEAEPEAGLCLLKVMLRRKKEEVLPQLPPKRRRMWQLPKPPVKILKLCTEALQAAGSSGLSLDASFGNLLQGNPTALGLISEARRALAEWKTPHLLKMVEQYEENEEPLVVFSAYRAPILALAEREGWEIIVGEVSAERRAEIQDLFQGGKLRGVACTIRAGGLALTLTHASQVVFVDLEWTPALNVQAEDRVFRIGQKRSVLVTHLVAENAIDQRVTGALVQKGALISTVVEKNESALFLNPS